MMHEEDAHLFDSVEGHYHPNIERSRAEYFSKERRGRKDAGREDAEVSSRRVAPVQRRGTAS